MCSLPYIYLQNLVGDEYCRILNNATTLPKKKEPAKKWAIFELFDRVLPTLKFYLVFIPSDSLSFFTNQVKALTEILLNAKLSNYFRKHFLTQKTMLEVRPRNLGLTIVPLPPSFPQFLSKVNNPSLPYFHYFFPMFHYCSCLISVLVSLESYSSLFIIRSLP